jgi:ABC-type transport system involved in multi-copper enzyme maturation permease subunit
MTALLRSELRKVTGTRLALGLLLGAAGIAVLALGVTLWLPQGQGVEVQGAPTAIATTDDVRSLLGVTSIVTIFALLLGVTFATTEYRHDTAATSFLAEPRRWRVLVAKAVVMLGVGAVYAAVVLGLALGLVTLAAALDGVGVPMDASVWRYMGMTVLATAANATLGLGVGAALRNQVGGIVAVLVWLFVVEALIGGLLPSVAPWTPFAVGGAMTAPTEQVTRGLATLLTGGYVLLALGAGTWFTERRDVV